MSIRRTFIIAQKGKQRYTPEKMQGARVEMIICNSVNEADAVLSKQKPGACDFFVIGDEKFRSEIFRNILPKKKLGWKAWINNDVDEDDILKAVSKSFPINTTEKTKESLCKLNISEYANDEFSEEDIAGLLMAADELQSMKICSPNPVLRNECIYDAFVKLAGTYIHDEETAKKAVSWYWSKNSQKLINPDGDLSY